SHEGLIIGRSPSLSGFFIWFIQQEERMHIPDGYLGPHTYGALYAVMSPIWYIASRRIGKTLKTQQIPLLAVGAAFSFVAMMFNVPIPGGTTGHAVGSVIVAILLGPWAAVITTTVVLVVQALLFGDGGITSIGASSFNMAFAMSFTGYGVYKLISIGSEPSSYRRWLGGAAGGYLGINIAGVLTGIELGIQPLIAHTPDGRPLYAPYPLEIAIPAMVIPHITVFGVLEGIVTALVIVYFQRTEPTMLDR
ncbi:MAG: cobalt transporter CbiM, partial [Nitrospirota bacterium]